MNLHHLLWDREGRTSTHAPLLLSLVYRWNLELITPWGEPTRSRTTERRNDRDGTIDHAWCSVALQAQYGRSLDYAGSDHTAQLVEVPARNQRPISEPKGWAWAMMDRKIVQAEAVSLRIHGPLDSPSRLDSATNDLILQLQRIADRSTLRRKTSYGCGTLWWNLEVDRAVRAAASAQRHYRAVPSPHTRRELTAAVQNQKEAIREARTRNWRTTLAKASRNPKDIWRLQRWARLKSHRPQDPAKMPPLCRSENTAPTATTHQEKAEVLAARFFPNPDADLRDIQNTNWEEASSKQRFELNRDITAEDIEARLQ